MYPNETRSDEVARERQCLIALNSCYDFKKHFSAEQLLIGLKDKDTIVRWSAAKGYVFLS